LRIFAKFDSLFINNLPEHMTTISPGQTITGLFSNGNNGNPLDNGANYNDYDLPSNLTNLSQIRVKFDPGNTATSTNTPGTTTFSLINATTNEILASNTSYGTASTFSGYIGLVDKTIAPGVSYKIRVSNPNLSTTANSLYSLSVTDQGQATSIVSRSLSNSNGSYFGPQIGTVSAAGNYSPLANTYGGVTDVALAPSGLLYGIVPSTSTYSADKLEVINPSIRDDLSTSVSDLKDTSGNSLFQSLKSLAFSSSNQLYAIGTSAAGVGSLYKINPNTNVATALATLPIGFNNSGDLVYDAATNRLIATSADTGSSNALWQIPLDSLGNPIAAANNPSGATKINTGANILGFLDVKGLAFEGTQLTGYAAAGSGRSGTDKITINSTTGVGTFSLNLNGSYDSYITGAATIVPLPSPTRNDLGADGKADILWRNDNGALSLWQMSGNNVTSNNLVASLPSSWKIAGTGDFNGDKKADIVWRNENNAVSLWQMNGSAVELSPIISSDLPSSWSSSETGDFNGDGKSDILWRNDNGAVAVWTMNGATVTNNNVISGDLPSSWKNAGTGDFNGDGKSDLLWRNDNGAVAIWQTNGTTVTSNNIIASLTSDWKAAGTGDFNGDGKTDILWRNDNGAVSLWKMDGNTVVAAPIISNVPTLSNDWKIAGISDYNGDGRADVLWRNGLTGEDKMWFMNGSNATVGAVATLTTDWKSAAPVI
jgi:FG-GAP-like repeat